MIVIRFLMRLVELAISVPLRIISFLIDWVAFNPKLGPLRYVVWVVMAYVAFAVVLVYVVAPIRGMTGQLYLADKLRYDAERWLATAIYDTNGNFAGTFDPRLDSVRDVNFTGAPIEIDDYIANPDHKSIPVRDVPEHYWSCLLFHEDRYLGSIINPFGIDFLGVLKIPYSTARRSIRRLRPSFGFGGSTLPMQLARVIYKTPPSVGESPLEKMKRKFSEWWLAPVIYSELTRDGDLEPLKQWAANHLWLAQRTGGTSLHGIEVASQIVFGKEAKELSIAEQFVLASAVNKPIILLEGSERLNEVRIDRWRYITEVRARKCAERLVEDLEEQRTIVFELVGLAGGPPDPKVKPKLLASLEMHAPAAAQRAQANPIIRANTLMPAARFGVREEMKQLYGFDWRNHVRGVTTSFDAAENLAFRAKMLQSLRQLNKDVGAKISIGYTLDPDTFDSDLEQPNVVVVAADMKGEIVRYFDLGQTASYFGSPIARNATTGLYEAGRDPRQIASVGKIIGAIAISNTLQDTISTLYLDTKAPERGLETCRRKGDLRRGRKAIVTFACSLNDPLIHRVARVGQKPVRKLIDAFGFNMPPANSDGEDTPPSTAAVMGLVSGSPRRVHHMSGVVLASLIGRDHLTVRAPTLVRSFDYINRDDAEIDRDRKAGGIRPQRLIRRGGRPLLKAFLQAPICYRANGQSLGTLKRVSKWCATRRSDLRLHIAKTGTQVTADPDATVDAWIAGGLQFQNGAAYSYIVLVGTGATSKPWARNLHSAQVAAPLLEALLHDLSAHAKKNGRPGLLPQRKKQKSTPVADVANRAARARKRAPSVPTQIYEQLFGSN